MFIHLYQALDRDRTEDEEEEFIYPYYFGCWKNLRQVFTWSGYPVSDGIVWEVRKDCNPYTLTVSMNNILG